MDVKLMQGKLFGVQVLESYNMEFPAVKGSRYFLFKVLGTF
jgi:hypothetical protein